MERFIGLDAHVQSCTVAVMGPTGRRIKPHVVETQGRALLELIRSIPGEKHLCLEEGKLSAWLYETLEPEVEQLVVCLPEPSRGNKSDARDAWKLADDLRCNRIKRTVYKSPRKFRPLREAVRAHETTRKDMGRAKNRLRSIYRERNVSAVNAEIYDLELGTGWLKKLPPAYRYRAEIFAGQLQAMTAAHEEATAWLEREASKVPLVSLLTSAPGIGIIRASQVVATVITPHRFRTRQQFWSYCGLAIVTRSSSDWYIDSRHRKIPVKHMLTRGLNRQRNPLLKNVFKGAADTVTTQMPSHPLYADYLRMIEQGTRPNLARLTIARRIASAVLAMWKNNQEYDPAKHISAGA
jgi:transposase